MEARLNKIKLESVAFSFNTFIAPELAGQSHWLTSHQKNGSGKKEIFAARDEQNEDLTQEII